MWGGSQKRTFLYLYDGPSTHIVHKVLLARAIRLVVHVSERHVHFRGGTLLHDHDRRPGESSIRPLPKPQRLVVLKLSPSCFAGPILILEKTQRFSSEAKRDIPAHCFSPFS
jgi:hypothetical protein